MNLNNSTPKISIFRGSVLQNCGAGMTAVEIYLDGYQAQTILLETNKIPPKLIKMGQPILLEINHKSEYTFKVYELNTKSASILDKEIQELKIWIWKGKKALI